VVNPVRITSPVKMPVSVPVSTSLYGSRSLPLVATLIGSYGKSPISSIKLLSKLWSGATIVM
jgi:hypothetical protein